VNDDRPPTDPAMKPLSGTAAWWQTGPRPILEDTDLAVTMIRVGMAHNALQFQLHAGVTSPAASAAERLRNTLCSLTASASFTYEAMLLAKEQMRVLRPLAIAAGISDVLLQEVGKLTGGQHSAFRTLDRARNQIGFHWDAEIVKQSLREYARNESLCWIEFTRNGQPVHRLAAEVLAHALIPLAWTEGPDEQAEDGLLLREMKNINRAMRLISEFFAASLFGFLEQKGARRGEDPAAEWSDTRSD
jgi:hypothetical protein